jgi:hypothetical protein
MENREEKGKKKRKNWGVKKGPEDNVLKESERKKRLYNLYFNDNSHFIS